MDLTVMDSYDLLVMKLIHYFIVSENYTPIIIKGISDEVWLENKNKEYSIIRIVTKNIINKEQYDYDILKTKHIVKQLKRKLIDFSMNVLSIYLDKNFYTNKIDNFDEKYISILIKDEDDFKTSYESLWIELKLLYEYDVTSADMLLNPIRRIIETFTKFNALDKTNFCNEVSGAKKLFDVNSHSIDDIEAELNGKTKQEVIQMFYDCFAKNDYENHFLKYWKNVSIDETGKLVMEN